MNATTSSTTTTQSKKTSTSSTKKTTTSKSKKQKQNSNSASAKKQAEKSPPKKQTWRKKCCKNKWKTRNLKNKAMKIELNFFAAIAAILLVFFIGIAIVPLSTGDKTINKTIVKKNVTIVQEKEDIIKHQYNRTIVNKKRTIRKEVDKSTIPPTRTPKNCEPDLDTDTLTIHNIDYGEINGNSMHPTIMPGDTTVSIPIEYVDEKFKRGWRVRHLDQDGDLIIHTILGVYEDFLRMSGDNTDREYNINRSQVTNVVCMVVWN